MPAQWILSFWMELICKKRLSVVFILFVWRYINGPVKLLSLETWPIVDFFPWRASTMGATNSSSSFETILVTTQSINIRAGLWFISVLQKWDAVHNNIQGRRKIGKLSLIYSKPRLYSRAKQRIVLCSNGFYCSLESVCGAVVDVLISLSCLLDSLLLLLSVKGRKWGQISFFHWNSGCREIAKLMRCW